MVLIKQTYWSKLSMVTAIAGALLVGGCKLTIKADEEEVSQIVDSFTCKNSDGEKVKCLGDVTGNGEPPLLTASGFQIPDGAILVAPDAQDGDDITDAINLALFEVPNGATVVLPKGKFKVSNSIIVYAVNDVTITGHGMKDTTLDFLGSSGDDGFRFEGGSNITVRDFGVHDTNKNGIKTVGSNGVHMTYTETLWTVGRLSSETPKEYLSDSPGAYGLYPVNSQNVIVENNFSFGSRDAGIYVGQTNDIIVRNNLVEYNVAGIEIENSNNADVYNNTVIDNTAGILAFDFPGLELASGGNIRIFNNNVNGNNEENVGSGSVSIAPPGTGILVFAVSDVEIYDNTIKNNRTSAIAVASYFMNDQDLANYGANYGASLQAGWSPLVKNVYAHDNYLSGNSYEPGGVLLTEVIAGYDMMGLTFPGVIYDGIGELLSNAGLLVDLGSGPYAPEDAVCLNNNINGNTPDTSENLGVGLVYGTDPNDPSNWTPDFSAPVPTLRWATMDSGTYLNCVQNRLPGSSAVFKGVEYGCATDGLNDPACSL